MAAAPKPARLPLGRNYFTDANGKAWTYKGVSMFLLYYRWLLGEDIGPVVSWCAAMGANVVRGFVW